MCYRGSIDLHDVVNVNVENVKGLDKDGVTRIKVYMADGDYLHITLYGNTAEMPLSVEGKHTPHKDSIVTS